MDIYFKVLKGARASDLFKIHRGATIGRSKADINLVDTKASSIHARIEEYNGALYYLDLNSTNGSYVDGKKIQKVKLESGLKISIGNSEVEVISEFDLKKTIPQKLSEWREKLYQLLQPLDTPQLPSSLRPLPRALRIRVVEGNFRGLEWIVGYSPRFLGPGSFDLCLPDQTLPSLCLKIFEEKNSIKIESANQKKYLFNGVEKSGETLEEKLSVTLDQNTLEFEFINDKEPSRAAN